MQRASTWPAKTELDTFLFARGGVRWRYYQPATQLSPPGVFNGYDFDTLGTRTLANGVLYPFGHGLSYTTFEYRNLRVARANNLWSSYWSKN